MSLDPRHHKSGRPVPDRKQTLAPISTCHNSLHILVCQLFPTESRNTGKGIYYNIFEGRPVDDNLYRSASNTPHNVINFDDYRTRTSSDRLSARDSKSHPSSLRSARRRRLGRTDRMARIKLSTRRSLANRLQRTLSACITFTLGPLLSDRINTRAMGRSVGEHQSSSESLRRIRETALDSLDGDNAS